MVEIDKTTSILPLFWDLASPDLDKRLEATRTLIVCLQGFQELFQSRSPGWEDNLKLARQDKDKFILKNFLHGDVAYSLVRLIKGLGSPREAARQGFSLAFTELLRLLDFLPIKVLIELILEHNPVGSSAKSEQSRNIVFGRLFGLMCLVQSEILVKPHVEIESWVQLLSCLEELKTTKSFIQESCSHVFSSLVSLAENSPLKSGLISTLWDYSLKISIKYPDELAPILYLLKTFPTKILGFIPETVISYPSNLIHKDKSLEFFVSVFYTAEELKVHSKSFDLSKRENLSDLANILKRQRPNQTPSLPFSWKLILDSFGGDSHLTDWFEFSFSDFWAVAVDDNLFSKSAGPDREYLGLLAIQYVLPKLKTEQLTFIFTRNFVKTLLNSLNQKDSLLSKFSTKIVELSELSTAVSSDAKAGMSFLTLLYGHSFNEKTSVLPEATQKTVHNILTNLDESSILEFIEYLQNIFKGDQPLYGIAIEAGQKFAILQMVQILKVAKAKKSEESFKRVIDFLLLNGLSADSGLTKSHPSIVINTSHTIRSLCLDNLSKILIEVLNMPTLTLNKSSKDCGMMSSGETWISYVISTIDLLEKDKTHNQLNNGLIGLDQSVRKLLASLQKHLQSSDQTLSTASSGLTVFLHHILYQLRIDSCDLESIVEDIGNCIEDLFSNCKFVKKTADDSSPEPVDVIIEILISLLSKPSLLLHEVSGIVFKSLLGLFKKSTFQLIQEVLLDTGDEKAGLLEADEDMSEDGFSEMDEIPKDLDVDSGNSSDSDSSDNEEEEEEEEEIHSDSDTDPVDPIFLSRVKEALGPAVNEDGDENCDDEQMLAFDKALANIFREKKALSDRKQNIKDTLSHIKAKLVSWLKFFTQFQSKNPLIINLATSLIELAFTFSGSQLHKNLYDKILSIILKDFKLYVPESVVAEDLSELLNASLTIYAKTSLVELRRSCSSLCNFALSAYKNPQFSSHLHKDFSSAYENSLSAFLDSKSSKKGETVFLDLMASSPKLAWSLSKTLLNRIVPSQNKSPSKSFQAARLISELLNQSTKQKFALENDLEAFVTVFFNTLSIIFNEFISKPEATKADYFKDLLKAANSCFILIDMFGLQNVNKSDLYNSIFESVSNKIEKHFKNNQSLNFLFKNLQNSTEKQSNTTTSNLPEQTKKMEPTKNLKRKKQAGGAVKKQKSE